jgi:hypothetical protein
MAAQVSYDAPDLLQIGTICCKNNTLGTSLRLVFQRAIAIAQGKRDDADGCIDFF